MPERMLGRIKNVRSAEGFCFIASADGVDRFAHQSACDMTLTDTLLGVYVEFDPVLHHRKGARAVNVSLVPNTPANLFV